MAQPWLAGEKVAAQLGFAQDFISARIQLHEILAQEVGLFWQFKRVEIDSWTRAVSAASDGNPGAGTKISRRHR